MTGTHRPAQQHQERLWLVIAVTVVAVIAFTALIFAITTRSASKHSALAAPSTSATRTAPGSTVPDPPVSPPASSALPTGPLPTSPPPPPLTYIVQPGDNLTVIAAWFHLHGYGDLYEANKPTIGSDPSLIHPGQIITISSRGMTLG